jgi:RNA polymerase sigma-70 factor (ECF subfamily)
VPHASNDGGQGIAFATKLAGARQGDGHLLGLLLQFYRPYLLHVANQEVAQDLQAKAAPSDLVQETLLRAQQCFGQFRGENEAELLGWLCAILHREVGQFVRRLPEGEKRPQQELDSGVAAKDETPSQRAQRQEEIDTVRAALAQLPEPYQQVIRLREFDKLSYKEIAERMGRSPEAVRKLWTRAVDQLSRLLKPEHGA